jgi:hypothetical protein
VAEVGRVGKAPASADGADRKVVHGRIGEVAAAPFQTLFPDPARDGVSLCGQQLVQVAAGDAVGGRDASGAQPGVGEPLLHVVEDALGEHVRAVLLGCPVRPGLLREQGSDQADHVVGEPRRATGLQVSHLPRQPVQEGLYDLAQPVAARHRCRRHPRQITLRDAQHGAGEHQDEAGVGLPQVVGEGRAGVVDHQFPRAHLGLTIFLGEHSMTLSGSSGLYSSSPLQRRWRDVRCVSQHVAGNNGSMRRLGAVLSGQEVTG